MKTRKLVEEIIFYCLTKAWDCRNGLGSNIYIQDVKTLPELIDLAVKEFDRYIYHSFETLKEYIIEIEKTSNDEKDYDFIYDTKCEICGQFFKYFPMIASVHANHMDELEDIVMNYIDEIDVLDSCNFSTKEEAKQYHKELRKYERKEYGGKDYNSDDSDVADDYSEEESD